MPLRVAELKKLRSIDKVIIHSLDRSLYQVSVLIDNKEHYVVDKHRIPLRSFNKVELQTLFSRLDVRRTVLKQESAYDEMIGQPAKFETNALEVPLGNNDLAALNDNAY